MPKHRANAALVFGAYVFGVTACSLLVDTNDFSSNLVSNDDASVIDTGPVDTGASSDVEQPDAPTGPCASNANCVSGVCASGTCRAAESCRELHVAQPTLPSGVYTIDPDLDGAITGFVAYCDMTTAPGGWTLVFAGRGKQWLARYTATLFALSVVRDDIAAGTHVNPEYIVIKDWPPYTHIYYERWLPASLTGRSYAAPGWAARTPEQVSVNPTTMNFWAQFRTSAEGWSFDLTCPASASDPNFNWACDEMPNGKRIRHTNQCNGCKAAYLWFQQPECGWSQNDAGYWGGCGAWNGFFPNNSLSYWRISTEADYDKPWPEYDMLQDGQPMPGYGLYVY